MIANGGYWYTHKDQISKDAYQSYSEKYKENEKVKKGEDDDVEKGKKYEDGQETLQEKVSIMTVLCVMVFGLEA